MPTIIINAHDHADVTAREPAWENAILVEGNEIFTLTDLSPDTAYTLRWKAPDRQYPDVEVRSCHGCSHNRSLYHPSNAMFYLFHDLD